MIGKSQDAVQEHLRAMEAAEKAYGVPTHESDRQQLRPPPPAHPVRNSYCRQAESVTDIAREHYNPPRALRDEEKTSLYHQPMQSHQLCAHRTTSANTDEDEGEYSDEDHNTKRRAVWLLIYLSALAPLLALPMAIYTLVTTILLLLLSPFFLLLKQRPISTRFYRFLAPPPEFQLGLISSSYETGSTSFHTGRSVAILVLVNTLAPFCAVAIAASAWVGGVFWFYTAILGNPDGKDERDDGREFVLTVRGWWERWLIQGLR